MRPGDALDRWTAGEIEMISPTVRMVACLDRFATADAVMARRAPADFPTSGCG